MVLVVDGGLSDMYSKSVVLVCHCVTQTRLSAPLVCPCGVPWVQVYSQPKMGWMVQVVDGGLSDMSASKSVLLAGSKQMTLFWTLTPTDVSIAVRGERPSGYLAIAFGGSVQCCVHTFLHSFCTFRVSSPVPQSTDTMQIVRCCASISVPLNVQGAPPLLIVCRGGAPCPGALYRRNNVLFTMCCSQQNI